MTHKWKLMNAVTVLGEKSAFGTAKKSECFHDMNKRHNPEKEAIYLTQYLQQQFYMNAMAEI